MGLMAVKSPDMAVCSFPKVHALCTMLGSDLLGEFICHVFVVMFLLTPPLYVSFPYLSMLVLKPIIS
jgi:hypothetical protein